MIIVVLLLLLYTKMIDADIVKLLDAYFLSGGDTTAPIQLVKHQIDSFNEFLDNKIEQIIQGFNPIRSYNNYCEILKDYKQKLQIYVEKPRYSKPIYKKQDGTQVTMTPYMARLDNLTYSVDIYVSVHIIAETFDDTEKIIITNEKVYDNILLGKIPIMVGSKACMLTLLPNIEGEDLECRYETGGYFIVNGNEKVLISQDRIKENYPLVFKSTNPDVLNVEIRSMPDFCYLPPKTMNMTMSTKPNHLGRVIRINTSFLKNDIPVFVLFRALGIETDEEIVKHIIYDIHDEKNHDMLMELRGCINDAEDIYTKEEAKQVILRNMTTTVTKTLKTLENLEHSLRFDLIPQVSGYKRKAIYIGYMVRKLLRIYLGYTDYDNRDSYINKRIDTPGILMSTLFRQCYGKMTKDMKASIEKDMNVWRSNSTPLNQIINDKHSIVRCFKNNLLDSWIKYALSTGNWGIKSISSYQNIKQGVSQVLSRMSYNSTLSHLRRINTAMEKNGKLVQPRKLDISHFGVICPSECFDPNTPILMWDGTIKKAEDIVIGDYLIDDKGNAVRVKSTCSGKKLMYEVIPDKNNFMNHTVTDNHILTLKVKQHKYARKNKDKTSFMWFDKNELMFKHKTFDNIEECDKFASTIDDDDVIDITIEKYLSLPKTVKKLLYIFKSGGINWETKDIALDPYILGMWLGDGLSSGYGFVTADKELLDKWVEWGEDNDATITKNKRRYCYTIGSTINCNKTERAPLKKLLAKYNLVNNKHIPLDYLTNDRKTRLAVLAGLIDTDGNVRANGHEIRICQGEPNYRIIYDAEFLARSLGFSCHMNDGVCTYTVSISEAATGSAKSEKRKKPYKELTITGKYLYEIPTVLPRKKLNKCNSITHEKKCESAMLSLFKLVKKDIQPYVGWQLDGNGRFLLADMSSSHNTPEGQPVGLVKNMALSTNISYHMCSVHIRELLIERGTIEYVDNLPNTLHYLEDLSNPSHSLVMVNGDIIGYHKDPQTLYKTLKNYKRSCRIYPMTSIVWNIDEGMICISTEGGRMYRPLLIVDDYKYIRFKRYIEKYPQLLDNNVSFEAFINPSMYGIDEEEGCVEYLDIDEINHSMIAMFPVNLKKDMKGNTFNPNYTHCEIHPSLINGVLGVNVPFSDHNQAPRNTYQAAMCKQALGIYATNYYNRIDTASNILNYPQKSLLNTALSKYTYRDKMPSGMNTIVAIIT